MDKEGTCVVGICLPWCLLDATDDSVSELTYPCVSELQETAEVCLVDNDNVPDFDPTRSHASGAGHTLHPAAAKSPQGHLPCGGCSLDAPWPCVPTASAADDDSGAQASAMAGKHGYVALLDAPRENKLLLGCVSLGCPLTHDVASAWTPEAIHPSRNGVASAVRCRWP